ncbi:MAG: hypothetical protein WAR77_07440 [Saprospiraceae bacterium]|nr:hypothetical protein [Saprospiraceae bacterium]MBK9223318.1 hypothetical protein [Saprospiraceae bacterium]
MYDILLQMHSWLRWLVLGLGIYSIYMNYSGWKAGSVFTEQVKKINTFFIASLHTQLILGLALYLGVSPMMKMILADFGASMKNSDLRFWSVEHMLGMIIGIAIAQIGNIKSKKQATDSLKFKTAFVWFTVALLFILLMIPFGVWNVDRPLFRF